MAIGSCDNMVNYSFKKHVAYCVYLIESPKCSTWGMHTLRTGRACALRLRGRWRPGRGGGSIGAGRGSRGGTASRAQSTRRGGWTCSRSLHTQRSWIVSVGRRTAGECRESSSCGTRGSTAGWRLSHTAHTCTDESLQRGRDGIRHARWSAWRGGYVKIQATCCRTVHKTHLHSRTLGNIWSEYFCIYRLNINGVNWVVNCISEWMCE